MNRREVMCALLAPALATTRAAEGQQPHRDTVSLDATIQPIENFGASDCWSMQKVGVWSEENRERVARLLFSEKDGIGLTCWRFNLGGGVTDTIRNPWRTAETFEVDEGKYDWTRQANERWFLRAARRYGVPQLLAFVNSPPGRMTKNGLTYAKGSEGSTNLKPGFEGQFARYLADILEHLRSAPDANDRVEFEFVSPFNEPQWEWDKNNQEGNRYSNRDIKKIALAIGREFRNRDLKTKLQLVESGSLPDMYSPNDEMTEKYGTLFGNYIDDLLGDSELRPLLDNRIGYHSYFSDLLDTELVQHRTQLRSKMNDYPDCRIWQTEYCILEGPEGKGGRGRDLTMDTALDVARVIHFDLSIVNVTAWQWWTALSPMDFQDGLLYTDYRKPGDAETLQESKLLWTIGNYSRYLRPGMERVRLDGDRHDMRGLLGSAYVDSKERRMALVYLNLGRERRQVQLKFELAGRNVRIGGLTPIVTSDKPGDDLKAYPAFDSEKSFAIEPRSAVTLVGSYEPG